MFVEIKHVVLSKQIFATDLAVPAQVSLGHPAVDRARRNAKEDAEIGGIKKRVARQARKWLGRADGVQLMPTPRALDDNLPIDRRAVIS